MESFRLEAPATNAAARPGSTGWLRAWRNDGSTNFVEFGSKVVVHVTDAAELRNVLARSGLQLSRTLGSNVFILQAETALSAVQQADMASRIPGVLASYPVLRRQNALHGPYAPQPTDFYYLAQWQLEHRTDGNPSGPDINVRAAWPLTMGEGITVAVADTGVELDHRELQAAVPNAIHRNFVLGNTNGAPVARSGFAAHGTEVAGLISAGMNDYRITGIAPKATLASWAIFDSNGLLASDEQLFDMYQFSEGNVSVQNHSWGGGNGVAGQVGPTLLETLGMERAVLFSRGGRGSVIVRSAGNDRSIAARGTDDGYPNNPFSIAVAAVNVNGRVASYSEPGSCVLVAAPSGDPTTSVKGLFTTDLIGTDGADPFSFCPFFMPDCDNKDLSDYVFHNDFVGMQGFNGTSASAPQISGIAALMLSVNPALTYRDVQQILALSSRQFDWSDRDLKTNSAGFILSHNTGFGIPDASQAVRLAQTWNNRPALALASVSDSQPATIPDDSLRVELSGGDIPEALDSIRCLPSFGLHADEPTAWLELVDIGLAGSVPAVNLTNKGALILRGDFDFSVKISNAAKAGAAFAVIYNYSTNVNPQQGGDSLTAMAGTDMSEIPAVFIGNSQGEALKDLFQTNVSARARIRLTGVEKTFQVNSTLSTEHVGVRVHTDHTRRGDLRITLVSPQGTRSVLQAFNLDTTPGPVDWTYWSTHHFFEASAGTWKVVLSDESSGATGSVQHVSLVVRGTQISDSDKDGLDDDWETARLGSLAFGPKDDPDGDGSWNAREQAVGTDPGVSNAPLLVDLSWMDLSGIRRARLTWPGISGRNYQVLGGTNLGSMSVMATNIPGRFPETEWLWPFSSAVEGQFFRIESTSAP